MRAERRDYISNAIPWEPTMVDGRCKICRSKREQFPWGRANCPGCSVVDALPCAKHLFAALLQPADKFRSPPTDISRQPRRSPLSPPPLLTSDNLRPDGKRQV